MSEEKPFYVYVHRRATDGRVFYVGKGKCGRIHERKNRNLHWHNIVNKHGFTANIVMRFDREECAFSFERALIKYYGRENLCNLTDGGEGVSGRVVDEMSRFNISYGQTDKTILSFVNIKSGEEFTGTRHELRIAKGLNQANLRRIIIGKRKTLNGWTLKDMVGKLETESIKKEIMRFMNTQTSEIYVGRQYDFIRKYGLIDSSVSNLVAGKQKTHKGWVFCGAET